MKLVYIIFSNFKLFFYFEKTIIYWYIYRNFNFFIYKRFVIKVEKYINYNNDYLI